MNVTEQPAEHEPILTLNGRIGGPEGQAVNFEVYCQDEEDDEPLIEQKLINQVCWTRLGVDSFTNNVNHHLTQGWRIDDVQISDGFIRTLCMAVLVRNRNDLRAVYSTLVSRYGKSCK